MALALDVRDDRLFGLFAPDAEFEVALDSFKFVEGPVWHPVQKHLTFNDITGNTTFRWTPGGDLTMVRRNSHLANGNTYDREGRLLTCHHGTSRVTRIELDGSETVLASHYGGKQFNSPNDVVVRSDGSIYFTDPPYGRMSTHGIPRERELPFCGVYRLDPASGDVTLSAADFETPNGLCFSPDETRLFVNDTRRGHIRVFDVAEDGTVNGGDVWAETTGYGSGVPDGMKFDAAGLLYCCGPGGVHVFDADARCLGVILVPEQTANFCWGDADLRTLYITASTSIYRVRMANPGLKVF